MEDVKVDVKLQANCGCGRRFRVGDGSCFDGGDVVTQAAAHAANTRHKMEMHGVILPELPPVIVADRPKDKRRYARDSADNRG